MKNPIPRKAPTAKRLVLRECRSPADSGNQPVQASPQLAGILATEQTRLIMQADNVGMEQLVAALTRISIPRRKTKRSNSTT
jgi:hypothetical protein